MKLSALTFAVILASATAQAHSIQSDTSPNRCAAGTVKARSSATT